MNKSKLREIYGRNNHYHEIKAFDIKNDYIKPNDYLAIKNFSLKLSIEYLQKFIIILFFNLFIAFIFCDFIKSNNNFFTKEFFLIIITFISLITILFHLGHMLYLTRNTLYKKAQYGVIKTKFFRKQSNSNHRVIKKYYAHVIFPSSNTLIRSVRCTEDVYNSISEGSNVLVISFDNKTTHIVLI